MNDTAKSNLDGLGTIGILSLVAALVALGFTLWANGDAAVFWAIMLGPLGIVGVVFTAAWMLGNAIVNQLAHQPRKTSPTE